MERIKQALERARQERQKSGGQASFAPASSATGASGASGDIVYTQTQTIEVSPELLRERRVITDVDQFAFGEAYRILRTQVLQRMQEKSWSCLAITSPGINEGKTLTAINLAISLALEINYTVLLVDADLRHPTIHTYFGLDAQRGLSDYLTSDASLNELLIHPAHVPRFVILPGGKALANSSEMLSSTRMARLVDELKSRYPSRIILFDLPPLLSAADTLAFSPYVDAALLVIEEGKTRTQDLQHALGLLHNTNLIGTVLNKSRSIRMDAYGREKTGLAGTWRDRVADKFLPYSAMARGWFNKVRRKSQ